MKKRTTASCGCPTVVVMPRNAQIEALLTVDKQGQMVLPKAVRERAGIKPGDKFGLVPLGQDKEPCCFMLVKASELAGKIQDILKPGAK